MTTPGAHVVPKVKIFCGKWKRAWKVEQPPVPDVVRVIGMARLRTDVTQCSIVTTIIIKSDGLRTFVI